MDSIAAGFLPAKLNLGNRRWRPCSKGPVSCKTILPVKNEQPSREREQPEETYSGRSRSRLANPSKEDQAMPHKRPRTKAAKKRAIKVKQERRLKKRGGVSVFQRS